MNWISNTPAMLATVMGMVTGMDMGKVVGNGWWETSTGGFTHLSPREWAEVLVIAAGMFVAGGVLVYVFRWVDTWDEFNTGPDGWRGWGVKEGGKTKTPQDGRGGPGVLSDHARQGNCRAPRVWGGQTGI